MIRICRAIFVVSSALSVAACSESKSGSGGASTGSGGTSTGTTGTGGASTGTGGASTSAVGGATPGTGGARAGGVGGTCRSPASSGVANAPSGCGGLTAGGSSGAPGTSQYIGTEGDGDFVVGPDYAPAPEVLDLGNPHGKEFYFTLPLAQSQIFNGKDPTLDPAKPVNTEREIFVYVPAAYKDAHPAPVLIMHDGPWKLDPVRRALDNLTISVDPTRKLPAFIVISVGPGGDDGKGSERGLEYDTMSDREARFIHDEVIPAVLKDPAIRAAYPALTFTEDPWGRAVIGCSSGGAAALTMGWFRPDLYRRIISYSGTLADQQDNDAPEEAQFPLGAAEYYSGQMLVQTTDPKPLRIFLHISDNERTRTANDLVAAAFKAKSYHYRYVVSQASGHCDDRVLDQTLPDTLVWAWRGYQP